MNDVAELIREAERAAGSRLAPGERVLASFRAHPRGATLSAVAGLAFQALLLRRRRAEAQASGFPVARSMLIALTDRRLLIWGRGGLTGRVGDLLGEVPLTRVAHISSEARLGITMLTFHLVDAPAVSVEGARRDQPDRLAEAFAGLPVSLQAPALEGAHPVGDPAGLQPQPPPPPSSIPEVPPMPVDMAPEWGEEPWDVPPPPPPPPQGPPPTRPVPEAAPAMASSPIGDLARAEPSGGGVALAERPPPAGSAATTVGACPRCFTKNGTGAAFCWKCLEPLGQSTRGRTEPATLRSPSFGPGSMPSQSGAIRSGLRGAGVEAPPEFDEPVRIRTTRAWSKVAVAVGGVLVCLVAVGVFVAHAEHRELAMPGEIIGLQRIQDPEFTAVLDQLSAAAEQQGVAAKSALYGYGPSPSMFVVAYPDSSSASTEELFRSFAAGFDSPAGRVRLKAMEEAERDGVPYACAPVTGAAWDTACVWKDGDAVGVVVERGLSVDRFDLAEIVRHDVER